MFELQEVVENTAFFRRTSAPTFNPTGDGWERQRYNERAFASSAAERALDSPVERLEHPVAFYLDQLGPIADPANAAALRIPRGQALAVRGWVLDIGRQIPAAMVDFVLDGVAYRTPIRVPRGDVATAYGQRWYLRSGFNAELPAAALTPGPHDLEMRILLAGSRGYVPGSRFRFEIQ